MVCHCERWYGVDSTGSGWRVSVRGASVFFSASRALRDPDVLAVGMARTRSGEVKMLSRAEESGFGVEPIRAPWYWGC